MGEIKSPHGKPNQLWETKSDFYMKLNKLQDYKVWICTHKHMHVRIMHSALLNARRAGAQKKEIRTEINPEAKLSSLTINSSSC